jgi:signal transduction histidine kinase
MAADDWEDRKTFLRLTKEEEIALTALQPIMEQHVDELVGAFYRHLLSFPQTRKFLTDDLITTRLKEAQKRYLLSLVKGPYDQVYEEGRRRIGQVHARLGLTPEWYFGAYSLYLSLLQPLIFEQFRNQPSQYITVRTALTKVIFLDMQLAIEAYIEKSSEGQEYAVSQLAGLNLELEKGLSQHRQVLQETQQQLRLTERLAELGTLAASMAHEIGTPMNVILGRAEFLMRQTDDEAIKKGLQTITAQVERITKLMSQFLTFAMRGPTNFRPVDMRRVVEDCLETVQERLVRHRIQVISELDEDLPRINGDHDHMMQVMLNLVLNAVQAMPESGTLRMVAAPDGDQHIKLTVADTGHGIPPDVLPKIFEPFVTTKERGQGTGLGLTVVLGIVQEHGGSISVDSTPGQGTMFTLRLPRVAPSMFQ